MKFGIVGNLHKENFLTAITALLRKLKSETIDYLIDESIANYLHSTGDAFIFENNSVVRSETIFSTADIIIAFGGDGTILRYAREAAVHDKPILGVNLGKLGFLAEVSTDELSDCVDEILRGDYLISSRLTIECDIHGQEKEVTFGVNDIVIDRGGLLRVIDVETYVDDDYLITFKGDGLILSTPTGSTGYSLSCGGPIVAPDTDIIIVTPISPHTLNARPVIIPAEKVVQTVIHSPEPSVQLAADGQLMRRLPTPVKITFRRSKKEVKLIKRKVRSFYDVLRAKRMWGRDLRVSPERKLPT